DPAEIGKNRDVEVAIVGDAREVLAELLTEMRGKFPKALERQREPWWRFLNRLKQTYPLGYDRQDQLCDPQHVISPISALAEIGKNRDVEVAIVGDAREVLAELLTEMRGKFPKALERQREPWWRFLNRLKQTYPLGYDRQDQLCDPQHVISRISALTGPEAV